MTRRPPGRIRIPSTRTTLAAGRSPGAAPLGPMAASLPDSSGAPRSDWLPPVGGAPPGSSAGGSPSGGGPSSTGGGSKGSDGGSGGGTTGVSAEYTGSALPLEFAALAATRNRYPASRSRIS